METTSVEGAEAVVSQAAATAGRWHWHIPRRAIGLLFIAPALLFLVVMIGYPLVSTAAMSFTEIDPRTKETTFVGLQNFQELLEDSSFWRSMRNTVYFTLGSTVLHMLAGLFFALLLNEKWANNRVRNLTRGLLILPWLFSMAAAALMWALLYQAIGPLNYLMTTSGLLAEPIDFLGDRNWAMPALIFIGGWKSFPFYMVIILGALQSIPLDLYDAAHVDGAGRLQRFRYVTLPLIRPILVTLSLIDIISTFGVFDVVKLLTDGGPMRATQTVAYYIYEVGIRDVNFGYGSAMSLLTLLILGLGTLIYVRIVSQRQTLYGNR